VWDFRLIFFKKLLYSATHSYLKKDSAEYMDTFAEPFSPRFKTFLYNCYSREFERNPTVSLQTVYNMAIEKYKLTNPIRHTPATVTTPVPVRGVAETPPITSEPNAFDFSLNQTTLPKEEKREAPEDTSPHHHACNIHLELIANHKKHRKL
jgi:hypothetical protein